MGGGSCKSVSAKRECCCKKCDEVQRVPELLSYIQTYVERDLRQMKNISSLSTFQRFLKLCAARTGQLLNLSSLANDCGVSATTVSSWLSILEASYILFLMKPHDQNFNKRLVKSPKLYFKELPATWWAGGILRRLWRNIDLNVA